MAWWTAHSRKRGRAEDVVFVREGFNWWALLFPFPWLVINGMWIVLLVALAAQFIIWALAEAAGFGEVMRVIASLAINLILGFHGNDLKRWTYERKGLSEVGLVNGDDIDEAEYRFFSETGLPEPQPTPDLPAPLPPAPRWSAQEPDFIFPGFGRS